MSDQQDPEFIDVIEDLGLDDPNQEPWDGTGTWTPVEPGDYVLTVKEAKLHRAKDSGKPSINITWEVASEGKSFEREIRHNYYSLDKSSKGFGRTVQLTRALQAPLLPNGGLSIASLVGLMCIAEVVIEDAEFFSTKKNAMVKGQNNRVINERVYEVAQPAPSQPAKPQPAKVQAPAPVAAAQANGKTKAPVGQVARK